MLNKYSCILDAAAEFLDEDVEYLSQEVGFRGDEIVWKNLSDPFCRRGFHIQEIAELLLKRGYALVTFDANPDLKTRGSNVREKVQFNVQHYLDHYDGIVIVHGSVARHAVSHKAKQQYQEILTFYAAIPIIINS